MVILINMENLQTKQMAQSGLGSIPVSTFLSLLGVSISLLLILFQIRYSFKRLIDTIGGFNEDTQKSLNDINQNIQRVENDTSEMIRVLSRIDGTLSGSNFNEESTEPDGGSEINEEDNTESKGLRNKNINTLDRLEDYQRLFSRRHNFEFEIRTAVSDPYESYSPTKYESYPPTNIKIEFRNGVVQGNEQEIREVIRDTVSLIFELDGPPENIISNIEVLNDAVSINIDTIDENKIIDFINSMIIALMDEYIEPLDDSGTEGRNKNNKKR